MGGPDDMAMETGGVEQAAARMLRTGEQLAEDWVAVRSAIAGAEGGLGTGRLADAYRAVYPAAADPVRAAADALPPRFIELSGAGSFSAELYGGANDYAYGRFDLLGG